MNTNIFSKENIIIKSECAGKIGTGEQGKEEKGTGQMAFCACEDKTIVQRKGRQSWKCVDQQEHQAIVALQQYAMYLMAKRVERRVFDVKALHLMLLEKVQEPWEGRH